jgi:hypothetical protein
MRLFGTLRSIKGYVVKESEREYQIFKEQSKEEA